MKSDFKHRMIILGRIFKAGTINFVRNAWLSIAAIAVMVITLSIVLFSIIGRATFDYTINQITSRIDISVYLVDNITPAQLQNLESQLKAIPNVKSISYTSKDQALKLYTAQNQNNAALLTAINETSNPLPASLDIKPKNPDNLDSIKVYLDKKDVQALQSDPTSYSGDRKTAIDKITHATDFLQEAGLIGLIVFVIISMLIIFNTIRMAIFNRRDELAIMRLLGASTWYIRGPFIVETMLYGLVAAVVSVLICNSLFGLSSSTLQASSLGLLDISYANHFFISNYWLILTGQIALGIVIGAASSYIATRRYLKFKSS